MKKMFLLLLAMLLIGCAHNHSEVVDPSEYQLTIQNIGTRSIKHYGRLFVDGEEVFGREIGERYAIAGFLFEWNGNHKWWKGWRCIEEK